MKRLTGAFVSLALLFITLMVVNPALAAAAGPMKHLEHQHIYEVDEDDGIVMIGVRVVNLQLNWGEVETQVIGMNLTQNFKVYTWDIEAQEPGNLLAIIEMSVHLNGTVLTDVWFPNDEDEGEGGIVVDEGIIDGHVVLQWHIKPFAEELPPEIEDNLNGSWNLWFEDGIELDRSKRNGEFPLGD